MPNRWNIPESLEREVIARDKACVYCSVRFVANGAVRRERASWEHIVNDARIVTRENIALCCVGCNASKGAKDLELWLGSNYCRAWGIAPEAAAPVVRDAIRERPR
ncbi:HNH endonuclease [Caldimonas caldifontis]|uniref:HNH endonuclease n=1 Tax=Caldimonas caldifontis TaxID=1452508 RepID=A0A2S5SRF5_9BURK|nr:HNH endonuclease [Caldimonas caldifontis]PPE65322.1 HNH endonuclease [Caldimonas caldifontis]